MDITQRWTMQKLDTELALHIEREQAMGKTVDSLYKKVVVGNGELALIEAVHNHSVWIGSVNRIAWIVVALILTQVMAFACLLIYAVLTLMGQHAIPIGP